MQYGARRSAALGAPIRQREEDGEQTAEQYCRRHKRSKELQCSRIAKPGKRRGEQDGRMGCLGRVQCSDVRPSNQSRAESGDSDCEWSSGSY